MERQQAGVASFVELRVDNSLTGTSNFTATTVITETIPIQGKVPDTAWDEVPPVTTNPVGTMMFRIGTTDRNPGEDSHAAEGFVVYNSTNGFAFQSINGKWCSLGSGNIDGIDPTLIDRWFSTTPTYAQWGAYVVSTDPSVIPPDLHYTMNDDAANQTVVDAMGNQDGQWVYQNTDDSSVPGKVNSALLFDGANDYLAVPDTPYCAGPALSVALWVKNTSTDINWDRIVSKKLAYTDANGFEATLDGSNSSLIYISGSSSTFATIDSGVNWPDNTWHHLVIVWDGGMASLYVDGVFKGSGAIAPIVTNTDPLHFGKLTAESTTMWQGLMDDIRVYNSAISQELVTVLYNDGNGTELPSGGNYIVNESGYSIGVTNRQIGAVANAPENFLVLNLTNGFTFKVVGGVWT